MQRIRKIIPNFFQVKSINTLPNHQTLLKRTISNETKENSQVKPHFNIFSSRKANEQLETALAGVFVGALFTVLGRSLK